MIFLHVLMRVLLVVPAAVPVVLLSSSPRWYATLVYEMSKNTSFHTLVRPKRYVGHQRTNHELNNN